MTAYMTKVLGFPCPMLANSIQDEWLAERVRTIRGFRYLELEDCDGTKLVSQACELLAGSATRRAKLGGLVITYQGKQLPAKAVLRLAYCLANNLHSETHLKFASGEGGIKLLRSLGFQAQRLETDHPIPGNG